MINAIKKTIKSTLNAKQQKKLINKYQIIKYKFFKPMPLEIILDISASCNASCPFCPRVFMDQARSKGYMDLNLYKASLEEARNNNISRLRLYSTAEPTLHPNFSEMIDIAKEMGFYISVSTNASKMHEHMEALLKVDQIQFSIEGWDKESYEFYRQPLKFDRVYQNIREFNDMYINASKKPIRQINLLLTKETNIDTFISLWGSFCEEIHIHFMFPSSVFEDGRIISKIPSKMEHKLYDFKQTKERKHCDFPFNIVTVSYDGKISLCCDDFSSSFEFGSISDGIKNFFYSKELNLIRNQFHTQELTTCVQCNIFLEPLSIDVEQVKEILSNIVSPQARIIFDY